jgi:hypothetical protein
MVKDVGGKGEMRNKLHAFARKILREVTASVENIKIEMLGYV